MGVDLSPIQPDWVPPNVRFMVDDVEDTWLRPKNYYDYVHSRHTVMAIKDWPKLMRQALEYVRPDFFTVSHASNRYPVLKANEVDMTVISNPAAGSSFKKYTTIRNATTAACRPTTLSQNTGRSSTKALPRSM
jgi:hypothetical protein